METLQGVDSNLLALSFLVLKRKQQYVTVHIHVVCACVHTSFTAFHQEISARYPEQQPISQTQTTCDSTGKASKLLKGSAFHTFLRSWQKQSKAPRISISHVLGTCTCVKYASAKGEAISTERTIVSNDFSPPHQLQSQPQVK